MAKKAKQINKLKSWIIILALSLGFIIVLYSASVHDRYKVMEEPYVEERQIPLNQPLEYQTEFCANRLTTLLQELHFLEKEISSEKDILIREEVIKEEEEEVIQIEKRESSEIKQEFDNYRLLCNQFDQQPTKELCEQFLDKAKDDLEFMQQKVKTEKSLFSLELHKTKRIYRELQKECSKLG